MPSDLRPVLRSSSKSSPQREIDAHHRAEASEQGSLGLLEFLPVLGLEIERGLARALVGASLDLDALVLRHDALQDLAECRGLAILASRAQVDRAECEAVSDQRHNRCGRACDTRCPSGGLRSRARGRGEGRERLLAVGRRHLRGRGSLAARRGIVERGERIGCTLVPSLYIIRLL